MRKQETQAQAESEETMLPLSLLQRVDVEDYDSDSASTGTQNAATHHDSDASDGPDSDLSDSDIEMTDTEDSEDSESSTVDFNQSAFEVLLAGRLQLGIFEDCDLEPPQAFHYQQRSLVLMPVAVILRWTIPLATVLVECSPSNKTSRHKRVNCKKR